MINLGRGCHLRKSATASSPSSPGPPELTGLTAATGLGLTGLTRLTGLTGLAGLTDRAHRTYRAHRAHPRCILHCKNNAKRTGRSSRLRQMVAHSIYDNFYNEFRMFCVHISPRPLFYTRFSMFLEQSLVSSTPNDRSLHIWQFLQWFWSLWPHGGALAGRPRNSKTSMVICKTL